MSVTGSVVKKGLHNFIAEVRNCQTKEAEDTRVEKELAHIRQKFTASQSLSSYQKTKYVWKLVYIAMLGYEVDFGHVEIISLLSSNKFAEKNCGYVATCAILRSSEEMMTLVVNSIRSDLISNDDSFKTLALSCISNLGGKEMAEALAPDVQRVLLESHAAPVVQKKAALSLLRIFRVHPDVITHEEWIPHFRQLFSSGHSGVLMSVCSLAIHFARHSPAQYLLLQKLAIQLLHRLVRGNSCPGPYLYFGVPCPWLQVKLLVLLQQFPPVPAGSEEIQNLTEILVQILRKPETGNSKDGKSSAPGMSVNKRNAIYAVLFEAINLIIFMGKSCPRALHDQTIMLLGRFLSLRHPNIRYLGLDCLSRMLRIEGVKEKTRNYHNVVLTTLRDADDSVKRRALDVVFNMCDEENAVTLVAELLAYLPISSVELREEMVLKIAVMAEKYAKDFKWYVDTILALITIAGSLVTDDIWHRVVQIVTNHEELQSYAAEALFQALQSSAVHETTVKVGTYILGEFGYIISEEEERAGHDQVKVLSQHFHSVSPYTKALMLTSFIKMRNLYTDSVAGLVDPILEKYGSSMDTELQQRALEYYHLALASSTTDVTQRVEDAKEMMSTVLEPMPFFPEDRESLLELRLKEKEGHSQVHPESDTDFGPERSEDSTEGNERRNPSTAELLSLDNTEENDSNEGCKDKGSNALTTDGGTPTAGSSTERVTITSEIVPKLRSWFKALTAGPHGVLFENQFLQIGVKHEYKGHQGKILIFYGNKTKITLEDFRVKIQMSESEAESLHLNVQDAPSEVLGGKQVAQTVLVECMQAFVKPPSLSVSFTTRNSSKEATEMSTVRHDYPLQLPLVSTKFMEALAFSSEDFLKRWKAMENKGLDEQEIVKTPLASLARFDEMASRFATSLGVSPTSDPTMSTNASPVRMFAGTQRLGKVDGQGRQMSLGCLVQLELNEKSEAIRVSVRAVQPTLSKAVKNMCKLQLTT